MRAADEALRRGIARAKENSEGHSHAEGFSISQFSMETVSAAAADAAEEDAKSPHEDAKSASLVRHLCERIVLFIGAGGDGSSAPQAGR